MNLLINSDAKRIPLADGTVNCVVTSPPYYGLRSYGHWKLQQVWGTLNDFCPPRKHKNRWLFRLKWRAAEKGGILSPNDNTWIGALGLEPTPDMYVEHIVQVFREVWRVLRDDGTVWLNLGDSYASVKSRYSSRPHTISGDKDRGDNHDMKPDLYHYAKTHAIKDKDLIGIPWMVAFALRADGWYLRSDIIWHKPNPMPESVKDRCTKAHEYIFLLTKSARYFYDNEAIKEGYENSIDRWGGEHKRAAINEKIDETGMANANSLARVRNMRPDPNGRNKRSVWTVTTKPYSGAHYAVFPPDLIEPCVLAGCPKGGIVLDPFIGSGTTAMVARKHGRKAIGLDLNFNYLNTNARERLQYGSFVPVADGVNQLTLEVGRK
jgi:DNA modification methylase